ncbi:hypothetical protein I79_011889 [Cricetulus griseus]|uniref:Uncharacterized protein n=1 Tax=Cricetulus griseus TaxID=10029 RepID=G3HMD3_CRIGR|nr:hypothetical protein I79_011889 [Cricetulus griseus]
MAEQLYEWMEPCLESQIYKSTNPEKQNGWKNLSVIPPTHPHLRCWISRVHTLPVFFTKAWWLPSQICDQTIGISL